MDIETGSDQSSGEGSREPSPVQDGAETESPPFYESGDLLQGAKEIVIRHHGECYRLRLTRNNKLILNK